MNFRLLLGLCFALGTAIIAASCAKQNELLSCPTGQEQCGLICASLQDDSENCGKCDNVCLAGQACNKGGCSNDCPTGNTKCVKDGGAGVLCVNPKTDNSNCGVCGRSCKTGEICFNGSCSGTCGDSKMGQVVCGAEAGAPYCANLKSDGDNCGKCGVKCTPDKPFCTDGVCQPTCTVEQTVCGGDGGAPYCADLLNDNANCGDCGVKCTKTLESCMGGACTSLCAPGQKVCTFDGGPYCVSTLSDNKNCGTCGNVCPSSKPVCSGGTCSDAGGGGQVRAVDGTLKAVTFVKCGTGAISTCTETAAETSCTNIGMKLVAHASDGGTGVVSLGATTSCGYSISYFWNYDGAVAGQCLVGVANAKWSGCCGTTYWHGNTVTVPSTVGTQFGYVNTGESGYVSTNTNTMGVGWGCNSLSAPASGKAGCTTYYVACMP